MKRRSFIQRVGLGASGVLMSRNVKSMSYSNRDIIKFDISGYDDLLSKDGMVMLRLNYSGIEPNKLQRHQGKFTIKKGKLHLIKEYFFHSEFDEFDSLLPGMDISSYPGSVDVVMLWISGGSKDTVISFPVGSKIHSLTISDIIKTGDVVFSEGSATVAISYLLDREIGELDMSEVGIADPGAKFSLTVMADPQGGNPFAHEKVETRMRIHNAFIDESVRLINQLDPVPLFNMVIGDIVDGQGHHADFRAMNDMLDKVNVPTLYELGNHETRYNSVFTPGYNMSAFDNYFAAQAEFNGVDKLLYSFNLGQWHFIVWPDPLRKNFWETHPHYFYWLEQDLAKYKDRPTIFFQHVPLQPIGILPLINYAESVDVKRLLLDILSQHSNVKYILSGHVHIPMKSSVKTAIEYRGMKLINLPAAGYRPRAFGEEDFNGGPSQGIALVEIDGLDAKLHYRTVTNEQFTYPDPEQFDEKKYPLWLNHKWQLANNNELLNGDFEEGLKHWHKRYVYMEDIHPSNICEVRKSNDFGSYLYLYNRSRGYSCPGQDRLPQSINRICQVIRQDAGRGQIMNLSYWIDPDVYFPENKAGTYIWFEGFEKGLKRLNVVYSNDYIHWHLGGVYSQIQTVVPVHMDITATPGEWLKLQLNPTLDFLRFSEEKDHNIHNIDTIAVNLGVWTLNEGYRRESGAGFADIRMKSVKLEEIENIQSLNNGMPIPKKEQKYLWWFGITHPAGEHQSEAEDLNRYLK